MNQDIWNGVDSMVRRPKTDTRRGSDGAAQFEWFKTSNAHAKFCDDWDVKDAVFVEAVLGLLSLGKAVMLGSSRDGGAISVTIYDGDNKSREWVTDSIEFDDLMLVIAQKVGQFREREEGSKIRAIGD